MRITKRLIAILFAISILACLFTFNAAATGKLAYGAATVTGPALNLRSGPSKSNSVITQLNEGDIVVILERTDDEWYQINYHGTVGYVSVQFLKDVLIAENFNAQGIVTGDVVNMRSRPAKTAELLGTYNERTVMTVIGINDGWYKVRYDGKTGYVRSDYMEITSGYSASSASASTKQSTSSGAIQAPPANRTLGQQIIDYAMGYLGSRYVYGGASPSGFDCSGFVTYVYKNFNYTTTRNASGQYNNDGVKVSKDDLYAGDLVFFSANGGSSVTHVGIYIGDNEFIHASTPSSGVIISRLDSTYYTNKWFGAKRIFTA
ncbi:MAG: SH3 domain-containing protein [Oscillospiraceae bacterium]|jgi:cell wall-associated NlpC family hydrolase|nr:SH3 domain-containing protein [Oscillospiraceae bacterium]